MQHHVALAEVGLREGEEGGVELGLAKTGILGMGMEMGMTFLEVMVV